jgi:hypothetical protein
MTQPVNLVPGRSCSGCTMCCKLPSIPELNKPRFAWCQHCDPAKGCKSYDVRPQTCRNFYCGYLTNPQLSDDWKPSKSKLMITVDADTKRLVVHVDPARPEAWRQEPFYAQIKSWAKAAAPNDGMVLVFVANRIVGVLPQVDKDFGELRDDQMIVLGRKETPSGTQYDLFVVNHDDPRATNFSQNHETKPV